MPFVRVLFYIWTFISVFLLALLVRSVWIDDAEMLRGFAVSLAYSGLFWGAGAIPLFFTVAGLRSRS